MEGIEELFGFFYHQAKEIPWNLYPNFPEYCSSDLISRIKQEWNTMSQDSQMGFLVAILTPYKRKITADYKEDVLSLLESGLGSESDVALMAKCIQHWVKYGYLDLSVYRNCDAFRNIKDKLTEIVQGIKWVPSEVEFLSEKVLESYDLPELVKEGLLFKQEFQIQSLKDRMEKYGVNHLQEERSPVRGEREKKTTPSSFLRRASRGSVTSPSSTFPKARQSLVKDSKAVVLDLKEIESLQMEQVKEKRKLEDEKIKKQKEKEEAKEARKLEKFRLEEEKKKHDQLKKEQDKIKREKAEEEKKLLLRKKKEEAIQKRQEEVEKTKRKGSNDMTDAKKTKFTPSQKVFDVIGNADLCTSEDLLVIEDFLQGRYKIHPETKQICLTERIFEDEQGNSKKEAIILILDYSQCKWRKVRKTASNPTNVTLPTAAES